MNVQASNRIGDTVVNPADSGDLSAIVCVHMHAFNSFFLTQLGPAFLYQYYRLVHEYETGIVLVASSAGTIQGFAVGFVIPSRFYRYMRSRRLRLAIAAMPGLVRRPTLLPRLLGNARRVSENGSQTTSARESELASIAVLPSVQGRGVGQLLVQTFISHSCVMGADCVSLTTDADGNDKVNHFYQQLGFRIDDVCDGGRDRRMHRYRFDFATRQQACDGTMGLKEASLAREETAR